MDHARTPVTRRRLLTTAVAGAGGLLAAACGGGSLGGEGTDPGGSNSGGSNSGGSNLGGTGEGGRTIRVGLVIPQAGVYTSLGVEMRNGWQLWLDGNANTMSGYTVETVTADEGDGPDTGVPAVQGLLQNDEVDVVVGIVNSATALGVSTRFADADRLLLIANAGAVDLTGGARSPTVWRTSFTNAQNSYAMGEYLAGRGVATAYVLAPDYAAGQENVTAFTAAFGRGGGTVSGSALTPFGTTQDFQPFLSRARASGAEAVFCFYSGSEAVSFVTQYEEFGLKDTVALYGSGFLTEGSVLDAQGASAIGVRTALHYSTEIDNENNAAFVRAYSDAHDVLPTCFAVATYDAAEVLSRALATTGGLDGGSMATALAGLGPIDTSPRGPWSFEGQSPRQPVYLRTVTDVDGTTVNAITEDLGEYAQPDLS